MKQVFFTLLLSVGILHFLFAQKSVQKENAFICLSDNETLGLPGGVEDREAYYPYIPYNYTESIPIHVNFIFLQQNNGEGGFQKDNTEHQRLWDEIEATINEMYATLKDSDTSACYRWKDPFLSDAKVRFIFTRVYIKDSYAWNRLNNLGLHPQCPPLVYISYLQSSIEKNPDIPPGINVFFTEDSTLYETYKQFGDFIPPNVTLPADYGCSSFPDENVSQIHILDAYCKYLWMKYGATHKYQEDWIPTVWGWERNSLAATLAHELGHSLNLKHFCNHYSTNKCPHALMNQAAHSPTALHNYIPPTEIGNIHNALINTRLKKFVPINTPSVGIMNISTTLLWNNCRAYADLKIAQTGKLTINGSLQVPKQSSIEVSGQLYLRNGNISCVMPGEKWNGIRVKPGGVLWLENTNIADYDIIVERGGILVLNGNVFFSNNHVMIVGDNCYVCAGSGFNTTANSIFKDNSCVSELPAGTNLLYPYTCSSAGWNVFTSKSSILQTDCYVQNQTISQNTTFVARNIKVGENVTSTKPKGPVKIINGAHVSFIATNDLTIEKGFSCTNGTVRKTLVFE